MIQTSVPMRLTGMPSSAARSADSADARTAMPMRVRRKNAPSASATIGTTMRISRCEPRKTTGSHVNVKSNGTGGCGAVSKSNSRGNAELTEREQLQDADRRDGEQQARRLRETTNDQELGDGAEHERGEQADGYGGEERPFRADDQRRGQHRGESADLALREVDDAVGAVDEHQAHRDERRQRAEDEAEEQDRVAEPAPGTGR